MNPADKRPFKCFTVRQGDIDKRLDCQFHDPKHHELLSLIKQSGYPCYRIGDKELSIKVVDGPFGSQLKVDEYVEQGVPLIRVANCRSGEISVDNELVYITEEKHQQLIRSEVLPGDVLLTKAGHILGYSAVFPNNLIKGNITSHLASIRPAPGIDPQFLSMYLSSSLGNRQIYRWGNKATRPELNTDEVRRIVVPIPPSSVQRTLILEMDIARKSRNMKLEQSDELLDGMDDYLLRKLDLTLLSEDERTVFAIRRKDIKGKRIDPPAYRPFYAKCKPSRTATFPLVELADIDIHSVLPPANEEVLVPYVGLPECDLMQVCRVAMRPYAEVKGRRIVKIGDILFARIEPSVFNKKYVYVDNLKGHDYAYTSTEFYAVTPKKDIHPLFLYSMFFCSFVFSQIRGKTTGSSGRRRIDPDLFAALQIPKPEKNIRDTIAIEVWRRWMESLRLREEAAKEWEAAKERFETQLLGRKGL